MAKTVFTQTVQRRNGFEFQIVGPTHAAVETARRAYLKNVGPGYECRTSEPVQQADGKWLSTGGRNYSCD